MKLKFNLPKPAMLVYYFAKSIGLSIFDVKNDGFYPPTTLRKLYSASVTATYSIVVLRSTSVTIGIVKALEMPLFGKLALICERCVRYFIVLFTSLIFLLMYQKILYIMNKLNTIGTELKNLGIKENREIFFNHFFTTIVLTNAGIIAMCVILAFLQADWNIAFLIHYFIEIWFQVNVMVMFAEMLLFIKQRFTLVNEKLYELFGRTDNPGRHVQRSRIFVVCRNPREQTQVDIEDLTDLQRFQKIELLHMELCDLVDRTTHLFAVPIMLTVLQRSIELILNCFWIYQIISDPGQLRTAEEIITFSIFILSFVVKIVIMMIQFFAVAHASVKTCREGNATRTVLSKVWYRSTPQDLKDEFFLFSLQLFHRPVTVSIFGFLDLNYSYLYKILCTVVAYSIILIQFDTSKLNHPE